MTCSNLFQPVPNSLEHPLLRYLFQRTPLKGEGSFGTGCLAEAGAAPETKARNR